MNKTEAKRVLGISDQDIADPNFKKILKKKFRSLAGKHHPDKEGGDKEKFQKINEANEFFVNDEHLKSSRSFGSSGFDGSFYNNMDDLEEMLRQARGQGFYEDYRSNQFKTDFNNSHAQKNYIEMVSDVTTEDMLIGKAKFMAKKSERCNVCHGQGFTTIGDRTSKCGFCSNGVQYRNTPAAFNLPDNVKDGQVVKFDLEGKSYAVTLRFKKTDSWIDTNGDTYQEFVCSWDDLYFGNPVVIRPIGFDSLIKLNVPANSDDTLKLKLSGRGLNNKDLYLVPVCQMPDDFKQWIKDTYEEIHCNSGDDLKLCRFVALNSILVCSASRDI